MSYDNDVKEKSIGQFINEIKIGEEFFVECLYSRLKQLDKDNVLTETYCAEENTTFIEGVIVVESAEGTKKLRIRAHAVYRHWVEITALRLE